MAAALRGGRYDGAEPSPYEDTDHDDHINANDTNSNDDDYGDVDQVWTVFRTNALAGADGAETWVALDAPATNPKYPDGNSDLGAAAYDFTASVALYTYIDTGTAGSGMVVRSPYGPSVPEYETIVDLATPEGYPVF